MPYQKITSETVSIIRPRWPRLPDNAAKLAKEILLEMQACKSDRPWAAGYAAGIVKSQYRRVIKPDGEEGYQTDGDVLRSAGRKSRRSPTTAPRKRAASVASSSRTGGRANESQIGQSQPKARAELADESEPKKQRRRSNTVTGVSKETPPRQFIKRLQTGWKAQSCESTGNPSTVLDDDEGMVTPAVDKCLSQNLITL